MGQKQLQVIQMVVSMLGTNPKVSTSTPDDINVVSNEVDACSELSKTLTALTATVDSTGRLRLEANWQVASGAVVMALGPRAELAAHAALNAQANAAKADARAAKAHAKAAAKTAAASALQHGTGDATITQPAPSAPAPSTTSALGPSASALAATPGTPGSTTIR